MSQNYYMLNLQKLLFMIEELHKRGYESLKAIPSLSPSGASWRLELFNADWSQRESASKWLECHFKIEKEEITESNVELADLFEREFFGFLQLCKGENKKYTMWFSYMLAELNDEELPYAFSDYYNDRDFWQTSQGKKIMSFNDSY